jgi:hypothetical protein
MKLKNNIIRVHDYILEPFTKKILNITTPNNIHNILKIKDNTSSMLFIQMDTNIDNPIRMILKLL